MRLFQCTTLYPSYLGRLNQLAATAQTFQERQSIFLADRHGAPHFLSPILAGEENAFQANINDPIHQAMWAAEKGMPASSDPIDILLAQIEHHRAEVFYSMDPVALPNAFLRRLPSCVRRTIAWRAAPTKSAVFNHYDLIISNFPKILATYRSAGCRVALFYPAHDPVMDSYAANEDRPVDIVFVGSFSRHHSTRAKLLKTIAALRGEFNISMYLESSRFTKIVDAPPWSWIPMLPGKTPPVIRATAKQPIFGLDLYKALSSAKIVLNGAIDMSGTERGNIRCFESMGCGCTMLTDRGQYPEGMNDDETMVTYADTSDAVTQARYLLTKDAQSRQIGRQAHRVVALRYSKQRQFQDFCKLAT
jgi:hypothetical protein